MLTDRPEMAMAGYVVSAQYAELAVKGRKRSRYERVLIRNLREALEGRFNFAVKHSRVVTYVEDLGVAREVARVAARIPGVRWVGVGISVQRDMGALLEAVREVAPRELREGETFAVKAFRADKTFPLNSHEIQVEVGRAIAEATGASVDLSEPSRRFYVVVMSGEILLLWERYEGVGGLPVGTSPPVLVLFSGGIDSPVAAWLMLRRGCPVHLLHFHALPSDEDVIGSKVFRIFSTLRQYHRGIRLFTVSYVHFLKRALDADPRLELALFKRFMHVVADRLAPRVGALGVVTGDSLGQVASQTLESMYAVTRGLELPVYRPLIGMDKEEIVNLAMRIGTFHDSVSEYADCCSIVSRRPKTRPRPSEVEKEWERLGLDEAVREALSSVTEISHEGKLVGRIAS
ncbi:MAG: tRNA uracil 4-sulfurtransferase ThiI [Nitrososphaerota archaeon]